MSSGGGAGGTIDRDIKREQDCWPPRSSISCEDPFETNYDVCHPVRAGTERYLRTEMARAHHLIRAAAVKMRAPPPPARHPALSPLPPVYPFPDFGAFRAGHPSMSQNHGVAPTP